VRPVEIGPTRSSRVLRAAQRWYRRWILPRVSNPIHRQRMKLGWYGWGYWPVLRLESLSWRARVHLIGRFFRIDWHILHAHLPSEIATLCRTLAAHPARKGEVIVEAGCWRGGSSAKLSIIAKTFGYQLLIYDSFEGVERLPAEEAAREWEFGGQYASSEAVLRENLARYGEIGVCMVQKGWFSETLAKYAVPRSVRLAYIDCDLGKGTKEALDGIVPSLADDGWIFSQDFHIEPVRRVLFDATTWDAFGLGTPVITPHGEFLASIRFQSCFHSPSKT
jgi:O-methyltransferase